MLCTAPAAAAHVSALGARSSLTNAATQPHSLICAILRASVVMLCKHSIALACTCVQRICMCVYSIKFISQLLMIGGTCVQCSSTLKVPSSALCDQCCSYDPALPLLHTHMWFTHLCEARR
jgi:hypothetical protein